MKRNRNELKVIIFPNYISHLHHIQIISIVIFLITSLTFPSTFSVTKENQESEKTYSFGNHSPPTFIKCPLHNRIVSSWRTRPDHKRVGHVQPIDRHTEIRLRLSLAGGNHSEPKSTSTSQIRPGPIQSEVGNWVFSSELGKIEGRHGSRNSSSLQQKKKKKKEGKEKKGD